MENDRHGAVGAKDGLWEGELEGAIEGLKLGTFVGLAVVGSAVSATTGLLVGMLDPEHVISHWISATVDPINFHSLMESNPLSKSEDTRTCPLAFWNNHLT